MRDGLARAETRTTLLSTGISGATASHLDTFGLLQTIISNSGTSPGVGLIIQVGSSLTNNGGAGSCIFNTPYSAANSYFFLSILSSGTNTAIGSFIGIPSNFTITGCRITGKVDTPYNWLAVGT